MWRDECAALFAFFGVVLMSMRSGADTDATPWWRRGRGCDGGWQPASQVGVPAPYALADLRHGAFPSSMTSMQSKVKADDGCSLYRRGKSPMWIAEKAGGGLRCRKLRSSKTGRCTVEHGCE